ncbi:ABC transporter ATP-binding protein [Falsirhodobacter xinxiangensis]|uniref:ABC transporter ATP-binding protein n=1 Tax=Falsirhodobacter xinxiangensis TaxID=2530049 RepID=UPI0010AA92F5|nr:ATP-binding cassette domain-containing protein [Rhodobacter xinxiangensis]
MLEARSVTIGVARRDLFRDLSLRLAPGKIMGLCGPSGSGKTTLGRVLAGLHPHRAGQILLDGLPIPRKGAHPVQYLAQAPLATMNPRWRVARVLAEAGCPEPDLVAAMSIDPDWLERFPHELSGGQLQRVSILRALTVRPRYLIADEITAPLDPISQARIWKALTDLAASHGIGILAISHDAALLGRIVTSGIEAIGARPA